MNIDVVSSAAADPPATPQAAAPGGGGAVFGQFLDASNSAAAAPQPNAAVRPIATTATGKSSLANSPAAAKAGGHGDRAAESGDQPNLDSLVPCAGGLVLPGPAAFVPVIVPTGTVAPPATSILATADKAQVGAAQIVAGDTAAAASVSSAIATGPKSPNAWQAVVAAANLQTATPAATGQAASAQTTPQGVVNAPADLAISADPTLPPPIAGAAKPSAALAAAANGPSAGTPNNRGAVNAAATVSAQAAALLGRVSVVGAAQSPAATPTGAVGAPLLANSANSVIAATVASDGTAAPISTPQQATPLPPVSGNIDLSAKFSATAIPPHGEVGSPVLAKAKVEPRATAGAADAIVGKPPVTATSVSVENASATGTGKLAPDASLAAASTSGASAPSDDETESVHAADSTAIALQPRAELVGAAGTPAAAAAAETPVNPIAALHSVAEQVAIGVKRGVKAGNDQIQINLEPASLGKIAVRLDFAQDGRVSATFSADRADTLTLLNNDSRSLEQALRDAGLRADSGSLTFNMSGGDTGASARQFAQSAGYAASPAAMDDSEPSSSFAAARAASSGLSHDGSLDIHV